MKLTLTIPDDVFEAYVKQAGRATFEELVVNDLTWASATPAKDRWLLLTPADRRLLEQALGGLPVADFDHLITRLRNLAGVRLGKEQRFSFTPAQLAEIHRRAARLGHDPEIEVEDMYKQIVSEFVKAI